MYVPSSDNTVNAPSRCITPQDATLSVPLCELIETELGPHTVDMMALGSYAICGPDVNLLPHFIPCVNVFSQGLNGDKNDVFPPFVMTPKVWVLWQSLLGKVSDVLLLHIGVILSLHGGQSCVPLVVLITF